jgi:hypothetical protein
MKLAALLFAPLLLTGLSDGQKQPPAQRSLESHDSMAGMQHDQAEEMKSQVAQMRSVLAQLKTNAAAMEDGPAKAQALLNAELWGRMVAHLEEMTSKLSGQGGDGRMACGQMNGGDAAACCAEMKAPKRSAMGSDAEGCCAGMHATEAGGSACGMQSGKTQSHDHSAHQH